MDAAEDGTEWGGDEADVLVMWMGRVMADEREDDELDENEDEVSTADEVDDED